MIPVGPAPWEPAGVRGVLDKNTLEIWRMPVGPMPDADEVARLTPEEQARAAGMLNPMRRNQFIAGRILLKRIRERHGARLYTSLSHSGQWVLAVTASFGAVGVDVEIMQTDRPLDRLSQRFFTAAENAWLAQVSGEERMHLFYRLWTAKEALFKALGMPVGAAHFTAREVLSAAPGPNAPESVIIEGCRVGWFSAAPGCMGAFAAPEGMVRARYLCPDGL